MTKILIISRDQQLTTALNSALTYNGFITETASTLMTAFQFLGEIHFNLILCDFKAKDGDILTFCRDLRKGDNKAPVVIMGECYEEVSILEGMYQGMDDYILKPFAMSELKMIINKQLERKRLTGPFVYGDIQIDVAQGLIKMKDRMLSLGRKEMEILVLLASKAGKTVYSDRLLTERRIAQLGRKLRDFAGEALQIKSVNGLGHKLIVPE